MRMHADYLQTYDRNCYRYLFLCGIFFYFVVVVAVAFVVVVITDAVDNLGHLIGTVWLQMTCDAFPHSNFIFIYLGVFICLLSLPIVVQEKKKDVSYHSFVQCNLWFSFLFSIMMKRSITSKTLLYVCVCVC